MACSDPSAVCARCSLPALTHARSRAAVASRRGRLVKATPDGRRSTPRLLMLAEVSLCAQGLPLQSVGAHAIALFRFHLSPGHIFNQWPTIGSAPPRPVVVVHVFDADLRKELSALIVSQEEHIESMSMGSYHTISAALAEPLHCQQRHTPVVLFGNWLVPAIKIRLIFDRETSVGRDDVLRFQNKQARVDF